MRAAPDETDSRWIRYRSLTTDRQVTPEIDHIRHVKLARQEIELPSVGPYEYSEAVMSRIRERIKKEQAGDGR